MAAVHFTTKPCEPNNSLQSTMKTTFFAVFFDVLSKLCKLALKILERFCTFLSAFFKFPCAKNYG